MAGILVSPGFDQAVRKRSSSFKQKTASPSFKDILRQRCRERFKTRRCSLLDKLRGLQPGEETRQIISLIVREEASLLSSGQQPPLAPEEECMQLDLQPLDPTTFDNFEAFLFKEYDQMLEEQLEWDLSLMDQSICPLCLSSPLIEEQFVDRKPSSSCRSCQVPLPPLEILSPALDSAYKFHSRTLCDSLPSCGVVEHSLYLICSDCSCMLFVAPTIL